VHRITPALALAALALGCAAPDYVPRPPEHGGRVWARPGSNPTDFEFDRASCETDWMIQVGRYQDDRRKLPRPEDIESCLLARGWRPQAPAPDPG
jgi:hypothetical protein